MKNPKKYNKYIIESKENDKWIEIMKVWAFDDKDAESLGQGFRDGFIRVRRASERK